MNDSTQITYEEVRSDAELIKERATQMRGMFDDFEASMKKVGSKDVFVGDASESLDAKFNKLKTKFDDYVQLINEFSAMITTASDLTAQTERELSGDVSGLQE